MGFPVTLTGLPVPVTGAAAATRYAGATASGAPIAGTFAVGDFVIDQTGFTWICTVAGTPGTWVSGQSSGGISNANATAIASGTGGVSGATTISTNGVVRMTVSFAGSTTFAGPVTSTGTLNTDTAVNIFGAITAGVSTAEPIVSFWSDKNDTFADYQIGLDVANSVNGDLYIGKVSQADGSVGDFIYCKNVATFGTLVGIGVTPPVNAAVNAGRLQVSAQAGTAGHGIVIIEGVGTTGDALRVLDSANNQLFSITSAGVLYKNANGDGVKFTTTAVNGRFVVFANVGDTAEWGFFNNGGTSTNIRFRYFTGGTDLWTGGSDGSFTHTSTKLGFYNTAAIVQQTRAAQLVDNSGGTSGGNTIAVVTDVASTANAVATLAAKVNALELRIHNLGLTA